MVQAQSLSAIIVVTVAIATSFFSLVASYVLWRARNRSALWNMVAAAVAVVVGALILLVVVAVLMRTAFGPQSKQTVSSDGW